MKLKKNTLVITFLLIAIFTITSVGTTFAATSPITLAKAKEIALKDAGLSKNNVTFTKTKKEFDDGKYIYDVEFYVKGVATYEYEIFEQSGKIKEKDRDVWDAEDTRKYGSGKATTAKTVKQKTGWVKKGNKWQYYNANGKIVKNSWKKLKGEWYHFDKNGYMQTGLKKISGKWYYFEKDGEMETGWEKIKGSWYYFTKSGAMKTGWLKYGNKWYFLKSSGKMARSEVVNGYRFNSSGVWVG